MCVSTCHHNIRIELVTRPAIAQLATCPVCYSSIRDGVSTISCGHHFCSICVRDYLTYKQQCPSCLRELHESGLWTNKPLQIVVEQLISLVPKLEQLLKREQVEAVRAVFKPVTPKSSKQSDPKPSTSKMSPQSPRIVSQNSETTEAATARVTDAKCEESSAESTSSVPCPVCQVRVPQRSINVHLDECLQEQAGGPRKKLPPDQCKIMTI